MPLHGNPSSTYGEPLTDAYVINDAAAGGATNNMSDTVALPHPTPVILCDAACTLKVITRNGTTITLPFFKGENWLWVQQIFITGSTLAGANLYGKW